MKRIIVALAFFASACDRENEAGDGYTQLGNFDTASVDVLTGPDTLVLTVEVASTPEQRQLGLMERTTLPEDHGMIFVFDAVQDSADGGFWMYRTRIPLDIAYIDTRGSIVTIHTMQPCASPNPELCHSYRPTAPYVHALEVNGGYFARHGVEIGDTVRMR